MPNDKNVNFHNLNDETPELERVFDVASEDRNNEIDGEKSSLFESEKSDVYFEDIEEDIIAEIEAEIEAENKLHEKRKKDQAKARKRDELAFRDAREKHERDMAEENARRARIERESANDYQSEYTIPEYQTSKNDTYIPGASEMGTVNNDDVVTIQNKSENFHSLGLGYENKDVISDNRAVDLSSVNSSAVKINETDYITLRENYENSKNLFKSGGDSVSDAVVAQYKEDSERFFEVQRKIDQGELFVFKPPVFEYPTVSDSSERYNNISNTTYHPADEKPSYHSDNNFSTNENHYSAVHKDYSRSSSREETIRSDRSSLNLFEQNMAQHSNIVYSSTSDNSTIPTSSSSLVINNITRTRYEALKQKYENYNNIVASYGEKEVPKAVLHKTEQVNKIFSAIQEKIDNGNLKVVGDSTVDIKPSTTRGNNGVAVPRAALGTQAFFDKSKDNFSPSGKRTGDNHIKPVGTPFQGSPLGKYDKLKIVHALEFGSPFETASRRSMRAISGALIGIAQNEQTGTTNTILSGQDRVRDAANALKTIKDLPRQLTTTYHTVQNTATSIRNVGRFLQGKEFVAHKSYNPITVKQINKSMSNPFSSADIESLKKKFGSNVNMSASKVKNKLIFDTANNKNIKAEIKALQSKGAALSASERKRLKSLIDQKTVENKNLRKLHGLKNAQNEAALRNRVADRASKKSIKKTIKGESHKKLSSKDKAILSRLKDKKNLLDKRSKVLQATAARKQLLRSLGGVLGKAMRESEDSTVRGILGASRVLQNRYVRSVLKVGTKTALLPVTGAKKVAGIGLKKLDNKLGVSSVVKSTVNKLEEKAIRKTLNSKVYKELHGGIYNRAKNKISSKISDKIKTRAKKGKSVLNDIKSKRNKVLSKYNNLKDKLKNSKIGKFASKFSKGFGKIADAFKFAKSFLIKVGICCSGFIIVVAFLGAVLTAAGGAVNSLFLGDDSEDGRIDLTEYITVLNDKESKFLSKIDNIASDPDDKYTNITVNYQTGTLVNNFKEILSMTAVYFNQNFTNKTEVNNYIKQLYDDSHYYKKIESEPYSCSGCEKRQYKCTDSLDKYATSSRRNNYNMYASRGGCIGEYYSCEGCEETTVSYTCDEKDCTGHIKTKMTCPGTHIKYHCDGNHSETICRGEHIDLELDVMVLGFNDIFYADSSIDFTVSSMDTSLGNVKKGELIGTFTVSHYCACKKCCGKTDGITASGTKATANRTIAVDPSVIPLGTHVIMNGREYIAEDTGGAIKGKRIDVFCSTHKEALSKGVKTYNVYKTVSVDNSATSYRSLTVPYLQYAAEANYADENMNTNNFLMLFGEAKEPKVKWSAYEDDYDRNDYVKDLENFDVENRTKPFTNAELNVFEYVKMDLKELRRIAKEKLGEDVDENQKSIIKQLIKYDKEHPDDYVIDPNSKDAKDFNFEGWTKENMDWATVIYSTMDNVNYVGLEQINQFSGDKVSYEGVVFKEGGREVDYYSQYDIRWKNLPYSSSTIGVSGCGPTSMAMIVSSLTDTNVDPIQMCNWASSKGYYVKGQGTAWTFVSGAAKNWGLSCKNMGKGNADKVVSALSEGKLVIMSTGSGSYYQGDGHFLVLRGVDENGKILVADPASKSKSDSSWTLEQITSGLKNWWIIG